MKKITKFGIFALLIVSLVGSVFAFNGNGFRNEAVSDAIETDDYSAWKEAKMDGLTQERFDEVKERHGQRSERFEQREQRREEMDAAIEEGYDAFVELTADTFQGEKLLGIVTEENFETFVAMHNARQDGDYDLVKELADELGFEPPRNDFGNHQMGQGKGMGKLKA
jgi:hypothetical protein